MNIEIAEKILRTCKVCSQTKPVEKFANAWVSKMGKRYYKNICATCFYVQQRDYMKKYHERLYKTDEYKAYHRERIRDWSINNPEKVKAHQVAGRLKDDIKENTCEKCGASGKLHMHHPDYNRPTFILTLCIPCHERIHHESQ